MYASCYIVLQEFGFVSTMPALDFDSTDSDISVLTTVAPVRGLILS